MKREIFTKRKGNLHEKANINFEREVEKRINVVCEQTNHLPGSLGCARCPNLIKTNILSGQVKSICCLAKTMTPWTGQTLETSLLSYWPAFNFSFYIQNEHCLYVMDLEHPN